MLPSGYSNLRVRPGDAIWLHVGGKTAVIRSGEEPVDDTVLSDSCLAKVRPGEPIFVIRAQDVSAIDTIMEWLRLNRKLPVWKYLAAADVIKQMHEWQQAHPDLVKSAD